MASRCRWACYELPAGRPDLNHGRCNIDETRYADYRVGNDRVADAVAAYPERLVGFLVINPHYPDRIENELSRCIDASDMKGIKLHPAAHKYPTDGPNYQPVWEFANAHRMPILIHGDTAAMGGLAARYPDTAFLNAHSGFGYRGASVAPWASSQPQAVRPGWK